MLNINFPKLQSHKELHIEMLEGVLFFSNKAKIENDENKKFLVLKDFIMFIRDHIINHLLGDDIEIKLWYDEKRKFDKKINY